jgi:hypothetical protein
LDRIRDAYETDAGMLNSASLIFARKYTLVEPNFELTNFVLYPNPNKGNFTLQFISTSKSGIKIVVHDVLGRKNIRKAMSYKVVCYHENIQLVNTGIILLTIIDGSKKEIKKDTDSVLYIIISSGLKYVSESGNGDL